MAYFTHGGDVMSKKALRSNASLLLAAAIWGLAFVAQSDAMNHIGPFAFTAVRCFLGALALLPVCIVTLYSFHKKNPGADIKNTVLRSVLIGAVCGVILFGATITQQIGIKYTTAGKAGFITALYIILVPVFNFVFFRNKVSINTGISVLLAGAGLYLLCVKEGFSIASGDIWVISCAFLFALQIIVIDRYAGGTDSALLSLVQFLVVAVISAIFTLIFEKKVTFAEMEAAWLSIVYTGVFSSAVAYTLQIVGQKSAENPTVAAILMSMESVFAAVSGWLILHETFSKKEFAGVILMVLAVVISQLATGTKKKEKVPV